MPGGVLPPRTIADALNVFSRRGTRSGFYRSDWPSVETLAQDAADVLFRRVLRNGHHSVTHTVTRQEQSWLQSTSTAT